MKIVLNTSPIIFLGKINCLHLLTHCATEILVPEDVKAELGDDSLPSFMLVKALSNTGDAYLRGALGQLHRGELSAMVLAQETLADFVILDDLLARKKAQRLGLKVMGTLGLLLLMAKSDILTPVQVWRHINKLTGQHGMYLSSRLMEQIRQNLLISSDTK
ncbi:MAG: DUF3368 domain-containing protein [Methylomicrobium sp.]|uniref:DUF3368 domain-containing protein n=1 Tax=Methylotuvimicrobium buryatense TaxID=95641 RepID=A0A4P9UNQ4_METBY|nr:hypothetical protein [Methylotuvimicrobium buryatense]MBE0435491.1 DUF3368 domain-containing protein [Methylomicrobium sp.]QCW82968.1 DUF3368 domain-containing protein [Methylotuvimicrobium buryatense]